MRRARFSLRWKFAAFAAGLVVVAVGALSLFTVYRPWRQKLAAQGHLARESLKPIARSLVQYTSQGPRWDQDAIRDFVSRTSTTPGLDMVFVLSFDAASALDPLASVANPERLERLSPALAALYLRDPARAFSLLAAGQGSSLQRVTVRVSEPDHDEPLGKLVLGVSTATIDAEARASLLRELLVLAAILLLGILGAIWTGGRLSKPLALLSGSMGRLQRGDFGGDLEAPASARDELGDLARAFNSMLHGLRERERLRGTLGRYVSGDVAERILSERDDLSLQGELRSVTVLFLDVRGFTSISELLTPPEVVELLNQYFSIVVARVQANGGSVNKFIGDAAMCLWGAPKDVPSPELCAVTAALEIQAHAQQLSAERKARGQVTVGLGIGINAGEVVAGNLGASERLEYTVIGDAVNLAQRLESQARAGEVLVSESVQAKVATRVELESRAPVKVKGKERPVALWAARCLRAQETA